MGDIPTHHYESPQKVKVLKLISTYMEELDDIIRYGSKELFADENDAVRKSRQIHYDDAAIDRLLNRDQVGDEEATLDETDEDGFLKAFKVANFEYIDEAEAAEEKSEIEGKFSVSGSEGKNYWGELLKDKYQEQKVEELNVLGKGKRNRTKFLVRDFSRLEDVSSDGEDDNYEVDLTDGDSNSTGTTTAKRPSKKKARNNMDPLPLMEGEGKSLRVLGFSQSQRAAFLQILMRFGVGDFDWKEFISHIKQKTYEEIKEYGTLFLSHIAEEINDSPTFSDGVPKEGLRIQDVLVRIAVLLLIKEKVKFASEKSGAPLFSDDILSHNIGLKVTKAWKEEHDLVLLHSILKYGYGKWPAIVDDMDLNSLMVICEELNIPFINIPLEQVGSHMPNGANTTNAESTSNQSRQNSGSVMAVKGAHGSCDTGNQEKLHQESSKLCQFREMQRKQTEFVKKRFLLLEKCINSEYQKEYNDDMKAREGTDKELKNEPTATNVGRHVLGGTHTQTIAQLPQLEPITFEEICSSVCDNDPDRLTLCHLYNEMCDAVDLVQATNSMENFHQLATTCDHVNRILTPENQPTSEPIANSDIKPDVISQTEVLEPESHFIISQDECKSRVNGV